MGRTCSGISTSPPEVGKILFRVIFWLWTVWHSQEWLCSSFSSCWQPGSGFLSQDLCEVWAGAAGAPASSAGAAGLQLPGESSAAKLTHCHCLLLMNALFSQAEPLFF